MPFSPRWLVHHGREADARKTLASLRDLPQEHELIELEFLEIKAQSLFEKRSTAERFPDLADGSSWYVLLGSKHPFKDRFLMISFRSTVKLQFIAVGSLFKTMPMFRRVILATVTMFFQQWTGEIHSHIPSSHKLTPSRYQRCSVLCTTDLPRLRSFRQYHIAPCHGSRRNCYVASHHSRKCGVSREVYGS